MLRQPAQHIDATSTAALAARFCDERDYIFARRVIRAGSEP